MPLTDLGALQILRHHIYFGLLLILTRLLGERPAQGRRTHSSTMAESESGSTDSGRRHSGSLLGLKLPPRTKHHEFLKLLKSQTSLSIDNNTCQLTPSGYWSRKERNRECSLKLCRGSRIPLRPAAMYVKHKHGMFKTAGTTSGAGEAPGMQGYIRAAVMIMARLQSVQPNAKVSGCFLIPSEAVKIERIGSMPLNC